MVTLLELAGTNLIGYPVVFRQHLPGLSQSAGDLPHAHPLIFLCNVIAQRKF